VSPYKQGLAETTHNTVINTVLSSIGPFPVSLTDQLEVNCPMCGRIWRFKSRQVRQIKPAQLAFGRTIK